MSERLQEFLTFFSEELQVLKIELKSQGGDALGQEILSFLGDAVRISGLALQGRCRPPIVMRQSRPLTFADLTPKERSALAEAGRIAMALTDLGT